MLEFKLRFEEPRFHRSFRNLQDMAHFFLREVVIVVQQEYGPIIFRQFSQAFLQGTGLGLLGRFGLTKSFRPLGSMFVRPYPVSRGVQGYSVDPGLKCALEAKLGESLPRF